MTLTQRGGSLSRARAESRRIEKLLTPKLVAELDATMGASYRDAQSKVPVDSSSLLNSGRSGSDVRDGGDTWIGYMAWGGESAPKDVDYAVYLMAAGGDSDWLRDQHVYEQAFGDLIDAHLKKHLT